MNKRISIRFYVAIVTLLLSLPSLADNIVIDKDAMIRMYGRELFNPFKNNTNLYGHITITKDFFTLKIPEQQISVTDTIDDWNIPDGIVHTIYKISEITISGNCKWSELHGKKRADYDGSLNVKPSSFKYENIQTYKGRKGERLVNVQHNYILIHRVAQKQEPSTWDNNPLIFDDYNHHNRIIICVLCSKVESTTSSKEGEQVKDSHGSESDVVVSIQLELIDEIDAPEETPTYEEDNEASDEEGIWKYIIPPFVGGCLVGWWRKRRKNKKQQKDDDPEPEPEPEEEEQEEEEDDEPDQLQMQVYKNFGDTLLVGDKGQQVNALIVRKPKKGPEYVDENLTRQIQIMSGDDYLHVEMGDIENGWKTAYVWAPEAENPPQEGIVKFVLANEGASYTNRLHFKVVKGGILFDPRQTNVTIPARHPEPVEVCFAVEGLPIQDIKEVTAFITDQKDEKAKEYEVRVLNCNEKADFPYKAEITDLLKDPEMDHGEPGTHVSYVLHIEARNNDGYTIKGELPLFRFYLGMQIETDGEGIGCYLEEYDPMKHLPNTRFKGDDGKQYVYSQTWCRVRIYDYDAESHNLKITEPNPLPDLLPGDGEATSECNSFIFTVEPATDARSTENLKPESHKQNILDNIDLRLLGRPSGKDSYLYFLTCTKGVLMPPTRMAVTINLTVKLKNGLSGKWKEYKCQKLMILWSQPKRRDLTPEAWKVVIKKDEELEDLLLKTRENITRFGLSEDFNQFMEGIASGNGNTEISEKLDFFGLERYQKLETGIDILLRTYTRDFGYDENTVMSVVNIFNNYLARCQVRNITMEQQAEAEMEDAMAPAGIKEWFDNRHKAFKELNFVESMALGFVTCGTFSVMQLVVNIGDAMYKAADSTESDSSVVMWGKIFVMGAWEAGHSYLMEKGMKVAASTLGGAFKGAGRFWDTMKFNKANKINPGYEMSAGLKAFNYEIKKGFTNGVDEVSKLVKDEADDFMNVVGNKVAKAWNSGVKILTGKEVSDGMEKIMKEDLDAVSKIRKAPSHFQEIRENIRKAAESADDLIYKGRVKIKQMKDSYKKTDNGKKPTYFDEETGELSKMIKNEMDKNGGGKYDEALEAAKQNAYKKIERLKHLSEELHDPLKATPETLQEYYKAAIEMYEDTHVINVLNCDKTSITNTFRAEFNTTMMKVNRMAQKGSIKALSQISGIPENRIMLMNASGSGHQNLINGTKSTYDCDNTYYYLNKDGNWQYFDQELVDKVHDLELRRVCLKLTGVKDILRNLYSDIGKKFGSIPMRNTNVQDVLNGDDSYGVDLENLLNPLNLRQKLLNPEKVAKTIREKGQMEMREFYKLMDEANEMLKVVPSLNPSIGKTVQEEALKKQGEALGYLIQSGRATVKCFKLLAARQAARTDLTGGNQISFKLQRGISLLDKLSRYEASPETVGEALSKIGYNGIESVTEEVAQLTHLIG